MGVLSLSSRLKSRLPNLASVPPFSAEHLFFSDEVLLTPQIRSQKPTSEQRFYKTAPWSCFQKFRVEEKVSSFYGQ